MPHKPRWTKEAVLALLFRGGGARRSALPVLENDDTGMFAHSKSLFGEMKCFDFQSFNAPTLARVLRFRGFEPEFMRDPRPNKSEVVCLARRKETQFQPMAAGALIARRHMYEQWRTLNILSASAAAQPNKVDTDAASLNQRTADE